MAKSAGSNNGMCRIWALANEQPQESRAVLQTDSSMEQRKLIKGRAKGLSHHR
jgi:hypothetical protein